MQNLPRVESKLLFFLVFFLFFGFLFCLSECGGVVSKPLHESTLMMMMMWDVCDVVDNNRNMFSHRKLDFEQ